MDPPPVNSLAETGSIILPPPEIRSIVDKTASFIAKNPNPETFEEKIRAREKSDSRFAFLNPSDAYHAYYQSRIASFKQGEVLEVKEQKQEDAPTDIASKAPPRPPELEFYIDGAPNLSPIDLDIIRLTALFTARSGPRFRSELAQREQRNYQFEFLRPSHSYYGYFNRLVEQYSKVLMPTASWQDRVDSFAGGKFDDYTTDRRAVAKKNILEVASLRSKWYDWEISKRQEAEDEAEAERIAFIEIDWQDFVVVSHVQFTDADEAGLVDLPPPMTLSEVENMTIAQKKMASLIMEGRIDEAAEIERQEKGIVADDDEGEMEIDAEDEEDKRAREREKDRQKALQPVQQGNQNFKVRTDYVPKANRERKEQVATTTYNGQQVPIDEFGKHIQIELLDPKWQQTKKQNEANRSAAALLPGGTDVGKSLRDIASHRSDIFGIGNEEAIRRQQDEAKARSKAREAQVWDGHTATAESITARYQNAANLDEQINALHRAKGLVESSVDPKIGPSITGEKRATAPKDQTPFMKAGGSATISAAPQPATTHSYGQYNTSSLPARPNVAYPGETLANVGGGVVRPAEEAPDAERVVKRPKLSRLPDGQYYPEEEWLAAHEGPITMVVQMPLHPDKPEWTCQGQEIELKDIPMTALVGSIRDRIAAKTGLPIGKQKLWMNERVLANNRTLAGLNFEEGARVIVELKAKK